MLKDKILPIGSVVKLNKAKNSVMVVAIPFLKEGKKYQYGGVLYPIGHFTEKLYFGFNNEDIASVQFFGYKDLEQMEYINKLRKEDK